jgi:hypothetical protein
VTDRASDTDGGIRKEEEEEDEKNEKEEEYIWCFGGKTIGNDTKGKPRRRWENSIKVDLREICWSDTDWIHLAQDRNQWKVPVKIVMNFRVA